jgi:hypothetical protein
MADSTGALTLEEIRNCREFVKQVRELRDSRFGRRVLAQKNIRLAAKADWADAQIINFDEEECRSFLLGCRLLIQNRDKISIQQIWSLFKEKIMDEKWFVRINPPRWMLNDFLNQEVMFGDDSGRPITNQMVLDTFLYGSYAHKDHHDRFERWQSEPKVFHPLKLEFIMCLQALLNCALKMTEVVNDFVNSNKSAKS